MIHRIMHMRLWLWGAGFLAIPVGAMGQSKVTVSFEARGCCPWCGENIEMALDVRGVTKASWDQFEQRVTVTYRPRRIDRDDLQFRVAEMGHDTEKFLASDSAYQALPVCCRYRE